MPKQNLNFNIKISYKCVEFSRLDNVYNVRRFKNHDFLLYKLNYKDYKDIALKFIHFGVQSFISLHNDENRNIHTFVGCRFYGYLDFRC